MQKITHFLLVAIFFAAFMILPFGSIGLAEDGVIKLKMADYFPIGHLGHQTALRFINRFEELSEGKVKVEYYPAQQLGKAQDLLKLCKMGVTDIAGVAPSLYAGQVPLNTVMVLPSWTTSTEGTRIYQRMIKECPELTQEFLKYGVRPFVTVTTSQYDVGTVNKPVRAPGDLKGLRLKSSGGIFVKIAKKYGIIPINIPAPEIYEATRRGVVDGNILSYGSVKGYRLNEIEKYNTLGLKMGGFPSTYQINEKIWQKLPKEIKKALLQAADENARWFSETWDRQQTELSNLYEKEGMKIYRLRPEDREMWFAPLKGIEKEWVRDMEKRKLPGGKVLEKYRQVSKEVTGG